MLPGGDPGWKLGSVSGQTNLTQAGLSYTFAEDRDTPDDGGAENNGPGFVIIVGHPLTLKLSPDVGLGFNNSFLLQAAPPLSIPAGSGDAFRSYNEGAQGQAVLKDLNLALKWHIRGQKDADGGPTNLNLDLSAMVGKGSKKPAGTELGGEHLMLWGPDVNNGGGTLAFPRLSLGLSAPHGLAAQIGALIGTSSATIGYDAAATNPDGSAGNRNLTFQGLDYGMWGMFGYDIVARYLRAEADVAWMGNISGDFEAPNGKITEGKYDNSLFMTHLALGSNPVGNLSLGVLGGLSFIGNGPAAGEDDIVRVGVAASASYAFGATPTLAAPNPASFVPYLQLAHHQDLGSHQYPGELVGGVATMRRYGGQTSLGGPSGGDERMPTDDPVGFGLDGRSDALGLRTDEISVGVAIKPVGKEGFEVTPYAGLGLSQAQLAGADTQAAFAFGVTVGGSF